MYVVIAGCGRVGGRLATALSAEGHDVAVIDRDPEAFAENLGTAFDGLTVTGTSIDTDVLRRAGVERAEALVCVTSDDSVNLMVAQLAQQVFGLSRVIARINQAEHEEIFHDFNIASISPTDLAALQLRAQLLVEGVQIRQLLGAGEVVVAEVVVDENLAGRSLSQWQVEGKIKVFGLIKEGTASLPTDDYRPQVGDILVAAIRLDALNALRLLLKVHPKEV